MVNSGSQPTTTLTVELKNITPGDVTNIEWDIAKKGGGSAASIAAIETTGDNYMRVVRAIGGGTVTVTARVTANGDVYTETRDISVIPYITTAEIKDANTLASFAFAGQTAIVKVYTLGGNEYDYVNFPPLTYQWRNASGVITGATGQTFDVPASYADFSKLYVEISSAGQIVRSWQDTSVDVRSADYGKLYPVAYDPNFTFPADKKDTVPLTLPASHTVGSVTANITSWTSNNTGIIANNGTVTLPASGKTTVTLTARFEYGAAFANRTFEITVWSQEEIDNETPGSYLQGAVASLGDWYSLAPVYGKDTNVVDMLKADLSVKGYGSVGVTVKGVKEVYGDCKIDTTGGITYFYANPNGVRALWFGQYKVTFALTKDGESLDLNDVTVNLYWDADRVKATMTNEILNKVTESAILGSNPGKDKVTKDLILPKAVDDKRWALIEWTSSDPAAITISTENQTTADTLFDPYAGKVKRGATDKNVTLTAAFTFQRTSGAEPPVVLYKTFTVTVPALTDAEKQAAQAELETKLNQGFAAAGLRDYVTKQKLVETGGVYSAVNDIQFPTTSDFKVDGKYYPITITSSDSDTVAAPGVANAARVSVYRPPVGASAKTVTLTVTISDFALGISASKVFNVEVQPLTQAEIDDALALMNFAKTGYFSGINGGRYTNQYSVTGGLCSFQEAVWNSDKTAVKWIYDYKDVTNNGIIADELDNWAEQEAWRAFRSSNPKIIDHETLNHTQPAEDTFVRINSVLTHEVFGKYAEAGYSGFSGLYKQPVSQYVLVHGKNHKKRTQAELDEMLADAQLKTDAPVSAGFTLYEIRPAEFEPIQSKAMAAASDPWVFKTTITNLKAGSTVFELFREALAQNGYTYTAAGSYVKSVTDPSGNTLGEKGGGPNSGWMYRVNGIIPALYMNGYSLENNDEVEVFYTSDYTLESGYNSLSGGIDYSAPDVVVYGSVSSHSVNLTRETVTFAPGFTPASFSVDGGKKWKAAKADTFNDVKFAKLLNKDLTLHISDKPIDKKTKKPQEGAVIVTFATIKKRPAAPKLTVNYLIAADPTGVTPGGWVLTEKGGTAAVKKNIQVGLADGKKLNVNGYGQFFSDGWIAITALTGTKPEKTAYFIRTAPLPPAQSGGAYTAAGKAKKVNVTGQQKAPKLSIKTKVAKGNKPAAATLSVKANLYTRIAGVTALNMGKKTIDVKNVAGTIEVWTGATAKKPASVKLKLTL
jgi:hypothetical protein